MPERLNSWKAIAIYLGRRVRTVQRWERSRGLPVHRLPGGERPRVFALKSELDAWLRTPEPPAPHPGSGIAVLPFVDLGSDGEKSNGAFGAGLAEDLIDELVRVPGLRVIARTSSAALAAEERDVREIGARLGAAWLVEGSVRREGPRVRVAAQLVSARTGLHAWSSRYDRELTDVFAIQDQIARAIAGALRVTLRQPRPAARPDAVAYELWVRGRALSQQYTPGSFAAARDCYEESIACDPLFARPHYGLAALLFQAGHFGLVDPAAVMPRAREAIARSLELDADLGEAHAVLGILRGLLDFDWAGADAAFRRALQLSPGSAFVLASHAWFFLVPTLRLDDAVAEARESVALDPLSPLAHGHLGLVLVAARDYARAREASRTAVELAPGLWWLHWFYATALLFNGDVEEGLRECWEVYEQLRRPLVVGAMAAVCGLFARREKALELLHELEGMAGSTSITPQAFALAHLGVGDDQVFSWLDRAITARDPMVTHLSFMPLWDGLRDDPRFDDLLRRIRLRPVTVS